MIKYVCIIGGIVICLGAVYFGGYTKGAANENRKCQETKITVIRTVEEKRQAVQIMVDSSSDNDVDRMLCEKYARGGCKRPDNIP